MQKGKMLNRHIKPTHIRQLLYELSYQGIICLHKTTQGVTRAKGVHIWSTIYMYIVDLRTSWFIACKDHVLLSIKLGTVSSIIFPQKYNKIRKIRYCLWNLIVCHIVTDDTDKSQKTGHKNVIKTNIYRQASA